jgi:dockerin type I repeat protein
MYLKSLSKSVIIGILCGIFCSGTMFGMESSYAKTYHVSKTGNDSNTGESWDDAFLTIKKAEDLSVVNDEIWVAEGTYVEGSTITVKFAVSMYGGFDGSETSIEDRNTSESKTIIDGNNTWQCVYNNGLLDGFNITNGYAINGGGIYIASGSINSCTVYSNSAKYDGGGIYNETGSIINCSLYSNYASSNGSGIYNRTGEISNCTLYANSSHWWEFGIYSTSGAITNCIIWNDKDGGDVYLSDPGVSISYSCFRESSGNAENIKAEPLFENNSGDIDTWDLHLINGSQCIDRGTSEGISLSDLEGNPRPGNDNKVCMGAYESPDNYLPGEILPINRIYVSKNGDNTDGLSWDTSYTSIIMAVNSINHSIDEIWVAEGTYLEGETIKTNPDVPIYGGFNGNETSFDDRDTSENKTIIDGNNSWLCVKNLGTIDGFYITGGNSNEGGGVYNSAIMKNCSIYNNYSNNYGGGIFNYYGGSVLNCKVYDNSARRDGGGIFSDYEGTVTNCTVYDNSAKEEGGGIYTDNGKISDCIIYSNISSNDGGGIYNYFGTIKNCTVYKNTAEYEGGGIYSDRGEVTDCVVFENSTTDQFHGSGGGICIHSGIVKNCRVFKNHSSLEAGGVYNRRGTISDCLIYMNSARNYGGGIYISESSVINCTIHSNSANTWGSGIFSREGTVINSIIWNNKNTENVYLHDSSLKISYSCFEEANGSNGNINANPLFANTSGDYSTWDYHLQNGSPCIDKGTTEGISLFDIDGNPRPGKDNKVCMGTYESPDQFLPGDPSPTIRRYVSKNGDNTDGLSWETSYTTIKPAIESAGDNFYEIWIAEGHYIEGERIFNPTRGSLYGGFSGNESSMDERSIKNHKTIIDGNKSYGCIKNYNIINGFHVINGNSNYCGGIYNIMGTVSNCYVYDNSASYSGGGINNYTSGTVTNCVIHSNSATDGGGIRNSGLVENCTVYSNSATDGGSGISNSGSIKNSIIWNNKNADDINSYGFAANISNSCFKEATFADDNISSDPMFVNTEGNISTWDFKLKQESPCIDSGAECGVTDDIDGFPRPQGAGWDMGAFEYVPQSGDVNLDGKIDALDVEMIKDYICGKITLFPGQVELADFNSDGIIDVADIISLVQFLRR